MLESEGLSIDVETDSQKVMDHLSLHSYDLVILDLNMPGENGLDLTRKITAFNKNIKVLIYTGFDIDLYFDVAMEAGACGIISKSSAGDQFITTVKCALRDEVVIPLRIARQLQKKHFIEGESQGETIMLTPREKEVLFELQKGQSNQGIADKIHMSRRSVENLLTSIFRKLEVNNRTEAVSKAAEYGYIPHNRLT